ncbi:MULTISPECIES: hypothetical protein [Brevibacillus]|uniref:hypothetical protein n=1 Tax=Brevibacillus TaxID=55080 RepID=UPI000271C3C2|nr:MULTISPECIES: hypothetical protein [Brevibacillus]EJL46892.1 hypothetical protein PMI08_00908 [Brevibacillus sp. CF112]MED1822652.1 hypothetical protein [Brevibacillus agri]
MDRESELLQNIIQDICYFFYRYEIKQGIQKLEDFLGVLGNLLSQASIEESLLQEINQLLKLILLTVEKKDFPLAADLLKYELFGRICRVFSPSL